MDYTLIDYKMEVWEERAYHYSKEVLRGLGFPVSGLRFKSDLVCRGLIVDTERGNLLKVDRFGVVRRAMHGTRRLTRAETFEEYGRDQVDVDLRSGRWSFLNTLFSVSEGCLYAQLVDRLDSGELLANCRPPFDSGRTGTYQQLHKAVSRALFKAHVTSTLKEEVMQQMDKFVTLDAEASETLLEQRRAGKKLALITNSDWVYTRTLMSFAFEPFLPRGMAWTELFDVVVVSACKPDFFSEARRPLYSIETDDGMLREALRMVPGGQYAGGNARMIEKVLQCRGEEVLYVGDHVFTDVNMAKKALSWRTCMILQELEQEVVGLAYGKAEDTQLRALMARREECAPRPPAPRRAHTAPAPPPRRTRLAVPRLGRYAAVRNHVKRELLWRRHLRGAAENEPLDAWEAAAQAHDARLREALDACEARILPMLESEGAHVNQYWGYISRAGWADKSHLMRQIEKYADIYTSRVSNLLAYTAYMRFTTTPQSLAHDDSTSGKHWEISAAVEGGPAGLGDR